MISLFFWLIYAMRSPGIHFFQIGSLVKVPTARASHGGGLRKMIPGVGQGWHVKSRGLPGVCPIASGD